MHLPGLHTLSINVYSIKNGCKFSPADMAFLAGCPHCLQTYSFNNVLPCIFVKVITF